MIHNLEIGPIWRALVRSKGGFLLISLQIAVTMALVINAIAIVQERTRMMGAETGLDEANIFQLASTTFDPELGFRSLEAEDLDIIRSYPGVVDAVTTNSLPLRRFGWSANVSLQSGEEEDGPSMAVYFVDDHGVDAFGVELIAGRNFLQNEIAWSVPGGRIQWPAAVIVSRAIASQLFSNTEAEDVVGKVIYIDGKSPSTIVGVVDRLQAPWKGSARTEFSALVPLKRETSFARYVIRTEPGYRDEVIPEIENALAVSNTRRIIDRVQTMSDVRLAAYEEDTAMIKMLVFMVSLLSAITVLGIAGLASSSVARRTKQIGIRRALGATRPAIIRYFLWENFLISSIGVTAGAVIAVVLNLWMVQVYNLSPIDAYIIPAAMLILCIVGQITVYIPARGGSRVSPSTASRSA